MSKVLVKKEQVSKSIPSLAGCSDQAQASSRELTANKQGDGSKSAMFRFEPLQKWCQGQCIQKRMEKAVMNDRIGVQPIHYSTFISQILHV